MKRIFSASGVSILCVLPVEFSATILLVRTVQVKNVPDHAVLFK